MGYRVPVSGIADIGSLSARAFCPRHPVVVSIGGDCGNGGGRDGVVVSIDCDSVASAAQGDGVSIAVDRNTAAATIAGDRSSVIDDDGLPACRWPLALACATSALDGRAVSADNDLFIAGINHYTFV